MEYKIVNHLIVNTTRLILRTITYDDLELVTKNMNIYGDPISEEDAKKEIDWMLINHRSNQPGKFIHLCLAVFYRENSQMIGWCGLDNTKKVYANPVIFYLLKNEYWNKGIATEIGNELLRIGFIEYKLKRIDGGCDSDNIASKRVMEKIGMYYLGLSEDGGYSFSICNDEYMNKNHKREKNPNMDV